MVKSILPRKDDSFEGADVDCRVKFQSKANQSVFIACLLDGFPGEGDANGPEILVVRLKSTLRQFTCTHPAHALD